MDLLNQTLNSFSTQIADGGVSLNFDIFEANLVNLAILDGGLFYLLSGALSESLSERQQKILGAIQESEEKLQEATTRLTEGETKLAQAQMVIESIQKDAKTQIPSSSLVTRWISRFWQVHFCGSNAWTKSRYRCRSSIHRGT